MEAPYYSQHAEEVEESWRPRACGIVSLRMALEAVGGKVESSQALINEGVDAGAYIQGIGWKHAGLVALAEKHGAKAYRKEFRKWYWHLNPLLMQFALTFRMRRGEVPIVSLTVEGKKDTHLVPLVAYDAKGFYFNEPAAKSAAEGARKFISYSDFGLRFRRLAIFISA